MNCSEKFMYNANGSSTEKDNFFVVVVVALRLMGERFLKRILTYCTKYNEINICHSYIQKHVSYEKWLNNICILYIGSNKTLPIHYGLCGDF